MSHFTLDIITPEKILFSAEINMVTAPGTLGDFGALPGHAPFISTLRPGVVAVDTSSGEKRLIALIGGVAEVVPQRCTILAETAVDCDGLNALEVQAKLDNAREALQAVAKDLSLTETQKRQALSDVLR
jgi:F-type H+-transporting ATPase subunit epsilon